MSTTRHVTVWCDFEPCSNWTDHGQGTAAEARQLAAGEGWLRRGGLDFCCESHARGERTHMEALQEQHRARWALRADA